uniref:Uncharacterized protein n=1 Tax=Tanacetum cinerariifolium TaxID=118510 RepID=A0A6L2K789_TANCI|nr:hypothetical protein [Tanacetum cinerariifolium]
MQTQTSSDLQNDIVEASGKDCPLMLAPDANATLVTPSNEDIHKWVTAIAKAVQIFLTGIDNDIYSTFDACPNAMEMWKAIKMLKQGYDRQSGQYDNQMAVNVAGASKNVAREDKPEDQELQAHYMYMAKIQEVTPDAAANSGPIFDAEPLQKVHNNNDDYNVFANDRQHPEQPESVNDTYLMEQCDTNITSDSSNMCNNSDVADQDDQMLQKERELLTSLIEKLKVEIDGSKQTNKSLESSNKNLKESNTFLRSMLTRYQDTNFVKNAREKCATAYDLLEEEKVKSEILLVLILRKY